MTRHLDRLAAAFCDFVHDRRGNVGIIFGLALVPVVGLVGASVDYGRSLNVRELLQGAADTAALTALNKFEPGEDVRKLAAADTFAANLASQGGPNGVAPSISFEGETVRVHASMSVATTLLNLLRIETVDVGVTTSAIMAPKIGSACVLALDRAAEHAITIDGTSDVRATNCVMHANSRDDEALHAEGSTRAEADGFCAVGGHLGTRFNPEPKKNCAVSADPLEGLAEPATTGCDYANRRLHRGNHRLQPGIYCHGLIVAAHATVTLEPGIYVIKDGPLRLHANSSVSGTGVVFYFTGDDAYLDLMAQSSIDVAAPTFGDYAGLVFVQDPDWSNGETSSIEGGGTLRIVGGVYLPGQLVKVGGEGEIGSLSSFMPIIANRVKFHGNAVIAINVDADAEGMPHFLPDVRSGTPRLIN